MNQSINMRLTIERARLALVVCCAAIGISQAGSVALAQAAKFDIGSGGAPSITGTLGGSVTGSSSLTSNLSVTVDFGELSPINTNTMVKVVVPVSIRSTGPYQVTAQLSNSIGGANLDAVHLSDIGFGIQNLRSLGSKATTCGANSQIAAPFNNDPALTANFSTVRVSYPSTLNNVVGATTTLNGPRLTTAGSVVAANDNGYAFDVILVIVPQFYATGNFTVTLTLTISSGPAFPCV